ncbi:hypothetical protein QJS10_CPA16g00470 [Acorus calamus]|uniref:Uncharacterized protein n=1 Tax=Acorus calamus TaxID=4465 RepID=A0AAV9D270_ACOCL|nr:hypothetical protein QJS10_CPA16g00470 [Acorus calamus]
MASPIWFTPSARPEEVAMGVVATVVAGLTTGGSSDHAKSNMLESSSLVVHSPVPSVGIIRIGEVDLPCTDSPLSASRGSLGPRQVNVCKSLLAQSEGASRVEGNAQSCAMNGVLQLDGSMSGSWGSQPFGPGTVGPDWPWTWYGKDPRLGREFYRPVYVGSPSNLVLTEPVFENFYPFVIGPAPKGWSFVSSLEINQAPHSAPFLLEVALSGGGDLVETTRHAQQLHISLETPSSSMGFVRFARGSFGLCGAFSMLEEASVPERTARPSGSRHVGPRSPSQGVEKTT